MHNKSKHITFFIGSMSSGGAEHQVAILSDLLVDCGYEATITTFSDDKDHYPMNPKIKRVRLAERRSKWVKFLAICWYFLTVRTDVVISFTQRANFFALIPLCFRRIKVIAGERSFSIGAPTLQEKILHRLLYRRANVIVPNSYSQRDYIVNHEPSLADKIVTITNYTDLEHFVYSDSPYNKVIRIGVFGRYNEAKNYKRLINAAYMLKRQVGSIFYIECYGNQLFKTEQLNPYYLEYKKLVEELSLDDVISLNDHVQNVAELMPTFDAICLPSLYEGWSNSISEAICCGKPMLVSDVSDNARMVHDGENGYLFNPESEEQIVATFERFFNLNADERMQMGKKSREIAEQLFDKEKFVTQYIRLIEN